MMRVRSGTSETWREAEDGSELHYELYWESADGGLCVLGWSLDGRLIWEADVPADVHDELMADAWEQTRED